jgi:integrase
MRVYKETKNDKKTGRTIQTRNYYIDFYDHHRRRHFLAAFPEKRESVGLADKIECLVSCQVSGQQPGPELQQWIDRLPNRFKEKFRKWGLLEGCRVAATKSLVSHLGQWRAFLIHQGRTTKQADQQYTRVKRAFSEAQFEYWHQIQASKLLNTINALRKLQRTSKGYIDTGKPISPRTKQHHLKACKQFASWMLRDGQATTNPLQYLTTDIPVETQNPRRALTRDEILTLLSYTENAKPIGNMTGGERALVYQLAIETGLRANEIKSLKRLSFSKADMTVRVEAKYTKNRKEANQPVKPATMELIQQYLILKAPTASAFNLPSNNLSKIFKKDIEGARAQWIQAAQNDSEERLRRIQSDFLKMKTKEGKLDFHALRHTFGSLLAASGVHPKTAQKLMRHSDINLTMNIYTHVQESETQAAIDKLPDFQDQPKRRGRHAS